MKVKEEITNYTKYRREIDNRGEETETIERRKSIVKREEKTRRESEKKDEETGTK